MSQYGNEGRENLTPCLLWNPLDPLQKRLCSRADHVDLIPLSETLIQEKRVVSNHIFDAMNNSMNEFSQQNPLQVSL